MAAHPLSDVTVAVRCVVLAEPGGGHDAVVDLQSRRVIGDPDCHGWTSLDQEVQQTSTKPSTNTPRFRQTQGGVPRHQSRSDLRRPDLARHCQTKPCCMACRTSGVRIPLAPLIFGPLFDCSEPNPEPKRSYVCVALVIVFVVVEDAVHHARAGRARARFSSSSLVAEDGHRSLIPALVEVVAVGHPLAGVFGIEVATGRLNPVPGLVTSWTRLHDAITALAQRCLTGRAVLTIG